MDCELSILPSSYEYERAVQVLREGGIVAYPTETYYGLAVNPESAEAVSALYRLKRRAPDKALSFLIPDQTILLKYIADFPTAYRQLVENFWPGPLTLIFRKSDKCLLPSKNDDKSLAFRISSHTVAGKFCQLFGEAITASSANISGQSAFSSAEEVKKQWGNKIDYILNGGKTPGEMPSTIIRYKKNTIEILRTGVVTKQEIRKVLSGNYTICKS